MTAEVDPPPVEEQHQRRWARAFGAPPGSGEPAGGHMSRRDVLLEWLLLLVVVLSFCAGFLDLGTARELPGNEAGVFQSLDWVLVRSLKEDGQFPLWNPYLQTGQPYLADPYVHVFNPLASVPVLLLGVNNGFKVALFLSFLAAAIGMWWLGRVLGLGRAGRLWVALMYACSGPAVARFFQGQYGFVLGFAWIPWVLASLIAVAATRRKVYAGLAVISLALLFFSGNVYYPTYLALAMVLFALVAAVTVSRRRPVVRVDGRLVALLAAIAALALGVIAVQLLPMLELDRHVAKAFDPALADSQTLAQTWLSLTAHTKGAAGGFASIAPEESYAYVGYWPFLALLLLPLAWWKGNRRMVLFLGLLLLIALLWADVRAMPWHGLYARFALLSQNRYPTRILVVVVLALVALAGMALDAAWKTVAAVLGRRAPGATHDRARRAGAGLGLVALAAFMAWSVVDVYSVNKPHARTRDPYPAADEIMGWLQRTDPTITYISAPNGWHDAVAGHGLGYRDAWYSFTVQPLVRNLLGPRPVEARPRYAVVASDVQPDLGPAEVVHQLAGHTIYRIENSLPFAFQVPDEALREEGRGSLRREEVQPVTAYRAGPNRMEMIVESRPNAALVALAMRYPGWQVNVDGKRAVLRSVGNFLATSLPPGVHKVVFAFSPLSAHVGFLVSMLTLVMLLALFATQLRLAAQGALAELRAAWQGLDRELGGGPLPQSGEKGVAVAAPAVTLQGEVARRPRGWVTLLRPEWIAFGLGLALYLVTRLWALDRYPIYFFTDEAIQPLMAEGLLARDLRDSAGNLFPIYVEADGNRWTPLLSLYLHALAVALFGKSIFVTRATSAIASILAVGAIGLILKWIFGARYWWAGVLVMAAVPAWFLHTRTAFEVVMMTSFYACFLLFYLLYRCRSPRFLFAAVLFGAAAFYSYSNGQLVIATLALFLFLSDLRYHLRHWRTVLPAFALALVLAWPLVSFRMAHPTALGQHLHFINSYWYSDLSVGRKLWEFGTRYAYGLNPDYWFLPNGQDLARHRMDGYGHISILMFPFFLIGLLVCVRHLRSSPHRAVLLAALATPVGGSLVDIAITRVLAFVVPASILVTLGLNAILERLAPPLPRRALAGATFAVLALANLLLLGQALTNGPFWFTDYGLYGMQYGARQLFQEAIPAYLAEHPDTTLLVSSTWSNGTDRFINYFLTPEQRANTQIGTIDFYLFDKRDLGPELAFVMTPGEYETTRTNAKFKDVTVEQTIPYPDGTPGFYFVRMAYADDVDEIFATEREERRRPVDEVVTLDGQQVRVRHSRFDMGSADNLFDGDLLKLVRGMEANPLLIELGFPEPRPLTALAADVGTMDFILTVELFPDGSGQPVTYVHTYRGLAQDPHIELPFDRGPATVAKAKIAIQQLNTTDVANIHVRELRLK